MSIEIMIAGLFSRRIGVEMETASARAPRPRYFTPASGRRGRTQQIVGTPADPTGPLAPQRGPDDASGRAGGQSDVTGLRHGAAALPKAARRAACARRFSSGNPIVMRIQRSYGGKARPTNTPALFKAPVTSACGRMVSK